MEKFKFLNKISQLPKTPGVYALKKQGEILYIGKAINIKERVKSHNLDKVDKIGFIKTDSEIEALILEADLIKKLQPKQNIVWKDDKNYFYICITKEDFPRVFITHQPKTSEGQALTIGPFVDGRALKETLKALRRAFPYRTCKTLPKKSCLWYQLQRCPAPCLFQTKLGKQIIRGEASNKKECKDNIRNLAKILQGKKKQALADLKRDMKKASKEQMFEKAAKTRNQIRALEKVLAHAKVLDNLVDAKFQIIKGLDYKRIEAYDVSNIQGKQATGSMVVFIDSRPAKSFYRKFKVKISGKPNDIAMIKEVLERRFKHPEWGMPDLILIDGGKAQLNIAKKVCSRLGLKRIAIMALAKKKNELFIKGKDKPVLLKTLPRHFADLILQSRDEAHRFALAYHKKLRKKNLLGS